MEAGGWDLGPAHIPHPKTTGGGGAEERRGPAGEERRGNAAVTTEPGQASHTPAPQGTALPPSWHFGAVEGPTRGEPGRRQEGASEDTQH